MWARARSVAAYVLLDGRAMRSLSVRFFALLTVALALVVAVGCAVPADPEGGGGVQSTYGAELPIGDDGDDDMAQGDVGDDVSDGALVAVDDDPPTGDLPVSTFAGTAKMKTTGNLNLRKGAGTSFAVIAVIPSGTEVTLLNPVASNGFLNIQFNGTSGWSSATYLTAVAASAPSPAPVALDGPPSPDNTLARARKAVGFSYYWGGGAWLATGPTASTKGSCSGSCPSCTHSGKYGADCSGLVAKAWQYGVKALEVNSHPYSTVSFNKPLAGKWSNVSRGSLKKGDALVYNNGSAGHIVIYEKGDGWGSPTVIECRGCSYGCVYNARNFTSNYHGIRRAGF
ncbi:MAG: SH3 domain-containing protein [Labilithrix sp.]|nr:SH3 domain-containing protein [Labilithrix sp.]